jgi:Fe2+ or Zn2+ uptake regulation protein
VRRQRTQLARSIATSPSPRPTPPTRPRCTAQLGLRLTYHPDTRRCTPKPTDGAGYLIDSRKWARLRGVPTSSGFEGMLRGVALRVTRPRVAVLSAVHGRPHAGTDSIIGVVCADLGEVSRQGVYDVLRVLTAAGLVRRFRPTGSVARYEARVGDSHHHVGCRSCGVIADVDGAVGYIGCLTAAGDSGYEIDEAEVVYWGRCGGCDAGTSAVSGG